MLVTCLECGAKISEEADPCPKCGFPEAGRKSKEHYERWAGEFEVEFTPPHIPTCHQCGHEIIGKRKVKNEVERTGDGYDLTHSTKCPNCGTVLKNYHIP